MDLGGDANLAGEHEVDSGEQGVVVQGAAQRRNELESKMFRNGGHRDSSIIAGMNTTVTNIHTATIRAYFGLFRRFFDQRKA